MEMVKAVADYLGIDADRLLKKPNRSEVPEESTAAPQEDGQHGPLFEPMKVSSIALRLATKLRNCTLNHILTGIRGLDKNRVIEAYKAKEYGSLMPGEIAVIARYLDIDTDDLTNGEPVPHYYVIVEKHWKEAKQ